MKPTRRFKRVLVNGARKEIKAEMNNLIKFNLGEDRDKEIQRRKDHEKAKDIFYQWQMEFINKPKPAADIPDALNELAAQLEREIKDKEVVGYIVKEMILPCIARSHDISIMVEQRMVLVGCKCECGNWMENEVPNKAWLVKAFNLECNICNKMTEASDCKLVKKSKLKRKKC